MTRIENFSSLPHFPGFLPKNRRDLLVKSLGLRGRLRGYTVESAEMYLNLITLSPSGGGMTLKPRNRSWTPLSVRFWARLARRDEAHGRSLQRRATQPSEPKSVQSMA